MAAHRHNRYQAGGKRRNAKPGQANVPRILSLEPGASRPQRGYQPYCQKRDRRFTVGDSPEIPHPTVRAN